MSAYENVEGGDCDMIQSTALKLALRDANNYEKPELGNWVTGSYIGPQFSGIHVQNSPSISLAKPTSSLPRERGQFEECAMEEGLVASSIM